MASRRKAAFVYSDEHLREVAFPLGGIGTGCVSLEGRGALRDWEIFNRPNKGSILPMTFPALWWGADDGTDLRAHRSGLPIDARSSSSDSGCLVLQGPRQKDFIGDSLGFWGYGHGQIRNQGDGLPCFESVRFEGRFPFARLRFRHPRCPLNVRLEAWSPFVPSDADWSGMPAACLSYSLRNASDRTLRATLAFTLHNAVSFGWTDDEAEADQASNTFREESGVRGLLFTNGRFPAGHPRDGTLALATDWQDVEYLRAWLRGEWFDSLHDFWDMFSAGGRLDGSRECPPGEPVSGTLGLRVLLGPGESVELPVVLSWCFPNSVRYWDAAPGSSAGSGYSWTNPYAKRWPSAWDAARDLLQRRRELRRKSRLFELSVFATSMPSEIKESVAATASTLRTPTCLLAEDGTFWAWEGCSATSGCCPGSCTHVWNYALTQAYLFPELHRSMRRSEYLHGFPRGAEGKKGAIAFRIPLPLGDPPKLWHAASDGQLGGVVQLYRDWKLCGDDDYLREMWPFAKRALEYAWVQWDRDRDGLVDGCQHNTYDINFEGPNPLTQGFYLAALRAGEEISRYLGDAQKAAQYRALFERGSKKAEEVLFNGEYFEQALDCLAPDAPKYQHGEGCLSDQLFGQWSAHVAGLGYLYEPEKVRSALRAIYRYNFRNPLGEHANMQRVYAMSDEPGLILCSWPKGGRPRFPFPYSDECWTGIEYAVAAHMIFEGMNEEGLSIVRAARARHDGRRRNPYNEFECGSHYARALSAWGLVVAWERTRGRAS